MMDAAAGLLGRYWGVGGRRCEACGGAPAAVHCRTDGAYLCAGCDAAHARAGHERVWVCEVCERAPAAVTCRADAAALCVACDADIHDANPLARRHERVPVQPFVGFGAGGGGGAAAVGDDDHDVFGGGVSNNNKQDFLFADDVMADPFLGPEVPRFSDSVVPSNNGSGALELDFAAAKKPSSYTYAAASLAHSGSSSEVGLVPDAICGHGGSVTGGVIELDFAQSKAAYVPYATPPTHTVSSSVDAGAGAPDRSGDGVRFATPATAESREARLTRYREKRKNRRFDKTIRYASRKAYAETRPRVKGRFAKRTDDADADVVVVAPPPPPPPPPQQQQQKPSYPYVLHFSGGYGVVPSF